MALLSLVSQQNIFKTNQNLQVRKTTTKDPEAMPEILPKDTVKPGNCRDTYQMPMFTKMFCEQWIEEAEHVDNWFDSGKFQSSALSNSHQTVI